MKLSAQKKKNLNKTNVDTFVDHAIQYTIVDEDPTVGLFSLKAFQILHVDRVRLISSRVFISSYLAPKFLLSIVKPAWMLLQFHWSIFLHVDFLINFLNFASTSKSSKNRQTIYNKNVFKKIIFKTTRVKFFIILNDRYFFDKFWIRGLVKNYIRIL